MTTLSAIREEEEEEEVSVSILVHGVCTESSIDKTAGRNGFVWLFRGRLSIVLYLICVMLRSLIFHFLLAPRDESIVCVFLLECVARIVDQVRRG
jgi:hypothetical protein